MKNKAMFIMASVCLLGLTGTLTGCRSFFSMPDAIECDVINDPNFIGGPAGDPVAPDGDSVEDPVGVGAVIYDDGETADVDTEGCYIVFAVGSRIMDICDAENEGCMINTGDLDEKFGIWEDAGSFEVCWYKWHQMGTTSPENWYLVRPKEENYRIECRSGCVFSVEYDGKTYEKNDYDLGSYEYSLAYFILADSGVECRADTADEYDYCTDISSSDAYNGYIVVAVKEIGGYEFGGWVLFTDVCNMARHVDTRDCISSPQAVLGTWSDAGSFRVCKYGYERTGGDVVSYYLIDISDENVNIAIEPYAGNDVDIYHYGTDNMCSSLNYNDHGYFVVSAEKTDWRTE